MSAKNYTETSSPEEIMEEPSKTEMNVDVLAELKAKMAKQKENEMSAKIVAKKIRSIEFGVVGSGQAGCKIAQELFALGYEAVAFNTASQDLNYIKLPESNKFLLQHATLQGAAKELEIGRAAAEANRDAIMQLISDKLTDSQVNIFCTSLGGGSGAGSCDTMVDILTQVGKPLVVITVLPMESEDSQTKNNALNTLAKLAKFAQEKKIANLIVIDNAKIASIYSEVNQMEFFDVANKAIVTPLDTFNTLSAAPSSVKALDSMEWAKLLTDSEGLSIYGDLTVKDYVEPTSIAEAVMSNLNGNLLAGGFELKDAKYVGVMIVANKDVWKKIPNVATDYAMSIINENFNMPKAVFKGIYSVEMPEDVVKVYTFVSGLSLPHSRIEQLKKEVAEHMKSVKTKEQQRNVNLTLDTGVHENTNKLQEIKDKIAAKSSAFGKFSTPVIDRRK
jgi:cell division GTPase FtsZ